jgi:hypothetical protein
VVVTEIAAHDDERLGTAPDPIEHRRDLATARVPDGERKERECAEDALEERQLDLERMLAGVRAIVDRDARQLEDAPSERIVDGAVPSGVTNASALLTARPSTGTRCAGPSSTTCLMRPASVRSRAYALPTIVPQ